MPPKGGKKLSGKSGRGAEPPKRRRTKSLRAGLTLPVQAILKRLRQLRFTPRVNVAAGVYLTAVLEYLIAEVIELAGNCAKDNKKVRIIPRHLQLSIRNDEELSKLLQHITIPEAGVLPNIHAVLLPKSSKKEGESNSAKVEETIEEAEEPQLL